MGLGLRDGGGGGGPLAKDLAGGGGGGPLVLLATVEVGAERPTLEPSPKPADLPVPALLTKSAINPAVSLFSNCSRVTPAF